MDEEPPSDFVTFVAVHLADAQREAARLTGGSEQAPEVCTEAFADLAGRWRRLRWQSRLAGRDVRAEVLRARLARRTHQWREDQIHPVEVRPLGPSPLGPSPLGPSPLGPSLLGPSLLGPSPLGPSLLGPSLLGTPMRTAVRHASLALRKAGLLPDTVRTPHRARAEASIAWADAYRRHRHHVIARVAVTVVLAFGAAGQLLDAVT